MCRSKPVVAKWAVDLEGLKWTARAYRCTLVLLAAAAVISLLAPFGRLGAIDQLAVPFLSAMLCKQAD